MEFFEKLPKYKNILYAEALIKSLYYSIVLIVLLYYVMKFSFCSYDRLVFR